ncbi:hypothetical protein LXL04_004609 [Taraxacum kok-saghyz]
MYSPTPEPQFNRDLFALQNKEGVKNWEKNWTKTIKKKPEIGRRKYNTWLTVSFKANVKLRQVSQKESCYNWTDGVELCKSFCNDLISHCAKNMIIELGSFEIAAKSQFKGLRNLDQSRKITCFGKKCIRPVDTTRVQRHEPQEEGLGMEKLEIKRLESSSSFSSRDFETPGRSIRRFLKNSTFRSRFLKKLKKLKHKQGRFKHLKSGRKYWYKTRTFGTKVGIAGFWKEEAVWAANTGRKYNTWLTVSFKANVKLRQVSQKESCYNWTDGVELCKSFCNDLINDRDMMVNPVCQTQRDVRKQKQTEPNRKQFLSAPKQPNHTQ